MKPPRYTPESINAIVDVDNVLIPEMLRLETGKKAGNPILLFLFTIGLFITSSIVRTSLIDISVLIVVLLVHEFGHLLTMKLMKYNDLKMFFIPFFGAAASGQTRNESVLKSCLVSIMGPLPGFLLGIGCFLLFGITKQYPLLKLAQMFFFLNALNILPITPLDGGRYVETLFFDSKYGRLVFSVLGALAFVLAGVVMEDFVFLILGVYSVFATVTTFKTIGIANQLKKKQVPYRTVKDATADPTAFRSLVSAIACAFPKSIEPTFNFVSVHSRVSEICTHLRMKTARAWLKLVLFLFYVVVLLSSLILTLLFVGLNYSEKKNIQTIEGQPVVYSQTFIAGELQTEIPINADLVFHGEGRSFDSSEDGRIDGVFSYESGYRAGLWLDYDSDGNTIRKTRYENGHLIDIESLENGSWTVKKREDLSLVRRLVEALAFASQPRKSLAPYFE